MIGEYKRSLKLPEAEEICDMILYRPFGFLFVKAIYRLPVTPNRITLLSLIFGLAAAGCFSSRMAPAMTWGALLYFVANVLDCSDGQLARLQNSGTLFGRVVDGVADYISGIAVFLAIGIGYSGDGLNIWFLLACAGVSSALHAIMFDHYQSKFISAVRGENNCKRREADKFRQEIRTMENNRRNGLKILILKTYLKYLGIQQFRSTKSPENDPDLITERQVNRTMIRMWSFLGPSTNRTLLIVSALFGRIDVYLWCVVTLGNSWALFAYLLQRRMEIKDQPGPTDPDRSGM